MLLHIYVFLVSGNLLYSDPTKRTHPYPSSFSHTNASVRWIFHRFYHAGLRFALSVFRFWPLTGCVLWIVNTSNNDEWMVRKCDVEGATHSHSYVQVDVVDVDSLFPFLRAPLLSVLDRWKKLCDKSPAKRKTKNSIRKCCLLGNKSYW